MPDAADTVSLSRADGGVSPTLDALRARFPAAALARGEGGHWSPDLALPASLWEAFGSGDDVAAEGFAIACAARGAGLARSGEDAARPWLWVQDATSLRRSGRPFVHGLPAALRPGLVHVAARRAADALWAMEEGVRCAGIAFVIGELAEDPRPLDFTATRRLVLASEAHGVPLLLVRKDGAATLSAARLRWRIAAAPSLAHAWNERAPGMPTCAAELFRARALRPGTFRLAHGIGGDDRAPGDAGDRDGARHRFDLVPELRDRPLDADRLAAR